MEDKGVTGSGRYVALKRHNRATTMQLEETQYVAYRNWANYMLSKGDHEPMGDLAVGLKSGVSLIRLLEQAAGLQCPYPFKQEPRLAVQELDNLTIAFDFMEDLKIQNVNIHAREIHEGNRKQITALMWNIINHFRVEGMIGEMTRARQAAASGSQDVSVNDFLLQWVQDAVKPMPEIQVTNLSSDFQDGVVFNAILACKVPGSVDMSTLEPDKKAANLRQAFETFHKDFGVPMLLEPDAIVIRPDKSAISMYLSFVVKAMANERNMSRACKEYKRRSLVTPRLNSRMMASLEGESAPKAPPALSRSGRAWSRPDIQRLDDVKSPREEWAAKQRGQRQRQRDGEDDVDSEQDSDQEDSEAALAAAKAALAADATPLEEAAVPEARKLKTMRSQQDRRVQRLSPAASEAVPLEDKSSRPTRLLHEQTHQEFLTQEELRQERELREEAQRERIRMQEELAEARMRLAELEEREREEEQRLRAQLEEAREREAQRERELAEATVAQEDPIAARKRSEEGLYARMDSLVEHASRAGGPGDLRLSPESQLVIAAHWLTATLQDLSPALAKEDGQTVFTLAADLGIRAPVYSRLAKLCIARAREHGDVNRAIIFGDWLDELHDKLNDMEHVLDEGKSYGTRSITLPSDETQAFLDRRFNAIELVSSITRELDDGPISTVRETNVALDQLERAMNADGTVAPAVALKALAHIHRQTTLSADNAKMVAEETRPSFQYPLLVRGQAVDGRTREQDALLRAASQTRDQCETLERLMQDTEAEDRVRPLGVRAAIEDLRAPLKAISDLIYPHAKRSLTPEEASVLVAARHTSSALAGAEAARLLAEETATRERSARASKAYLSAVREFADADDPEFDEGLHVVRVWDSGACLAAIKEVVHLAESHGSRLPNPQHDDLVAALLSLSVGSSELLRRSAYLRDDASPGVVEEHKVVDRALMNALVDVWNLLSGRDADRDGDAGGTAASLAKAQGGLAGMGVGDASSILQAVKAAVKDTIRAIVNGEEDGHATRRIVDAFAELKADIRLALHILNEQDTADTMERAYADLAEQVAIVVQTARAVREERLSAGHDKPAANGKGKGADKPSQGERVQGAALARTYANIRGSLLTMKESMLSDLAWKKRMLAIDFRNLKLLEEERSHYVWMQTKEREFAAQHAVAEDDMGLRRRQRALLRRQESWRRRLALARQEASDAGARGQSVPEDCSRQLRLLEEEKAVLTAERDLLAQEQLFSNRVYHTHAQREALRRLGATQDEDELLEKLVYMLESGDQEAVYLWLRQQPPSRKSVFAARLQDAMARARMDGQSRIADICVAADVTEDVMDDITETPRQGMRAHPTPGRELPAFDGMRAYGNSVVQQLEALCVNVTPKVTAFNACTFAQACARLSDTHSSGLMLMHPSDGHMVMRYHTAVLKAAHDLVMVHTFGASALDLEPNTPVPRQAWRDVRRNFRQSVQSVATLMHHLKMGEEAA